MLSIGAYGADMDFFAMKGAVEDGTTYIKLRDVEKLFPVSIGWDAVAKVATLSLNYKE